MSEIPGSTQPSGEAADRATVRRRFPKAAVPIAILFDVDGVLVDSVGWTYAAYIHALCAVGLPPPPADTLRSLLSLSPRAALRGLCGGRADSHAAFAAYTRFVASSGGMQSEYLRPFPGVPHTLAGLQSAGIRMGAVTSRNRADAVRHLRAGGVESL
jgi:phosphoglycolate phosphatase-like HAD superfamily hydrolase